MTPAPASLDAQKQQVADTARKLADLGLVHGTSGNVSARLADGDGFLAVTPTGKSCEALTAQDIVAVDRSIEPVEDGSLIPSSESLLHAAIYDRRPDVGGIVHTHAVYSSVAAVAGLDIPPILDEIVVALGGPVHISEYAPPASEELAGRVCEALGGRNAAVIRNHGAVAVGATPRAALDAAVMTERAAKVFVLASILGRADPLPDHVIAAEAAIFEMRKASGPPH